MSGCSYMLLNINALKIKTEYPATKKYSFRYCRAIQKLYLYFIKTRFYTVTSFTSGFSSIKSWMFCRVVSAILCIASCVKNA